MVGAKPSVRFTEWVLIICKSMEIAFQTERSVRIIVDGRISGVSGRRIPLQCLVHIICIHTHTH